MLSFYCVATKKRHFPFPIGGQSGDHAAAATQYRTRFVSHLITTLFIIFNHLNPSSLLILGLSPSDCMIAMRA